MKAATAGGKVRKWAGRSLVFSFSRLLAFSLLLLALLLVASPTHAAITIDSTSSTSTNAATISWSHTVGAGSSRMLIVGISLDQSPNTTSVSYGGTALTFVGAKDGGAGKARVEIWRLLAPAVGTANVVITLDASKGTIAGAISFNGVHQGVPTGAFAGDNGGGSPSSFNVASAAGELVFDVWSSETGGMTATAGAGQTAGWAFGGSASSGAASTEPGAASVTMSWTYSGGGKWGHGAVSIKPAPTANVAATKSGLTNVLAGTNFTYTIGATNLGPNTGSNVVVQDTLPAGVTFVSASSGGTVSGGIVTWPTISSFVNAAFTNYTVTVTAPFSGILTNIVASTSTTDDPVPSNNDGSSASSTVITTITPLADVAVTKIGLTNVHAGTNFTYTITITNKGPSTASSIVVTDTLPATVTFVSANGGGSHNSGVVTWPLMAMTSDATTNFTVTVMAPASGTLTNVVSSSSSTADTDASNNNGSSANAKVVTTLTPVADVSTTKSGITNAHAGTNITYMITVTNKGPSTASAVVASDTLPTGATFVSANGGGSESGGVVTWPSMSIANAATTNFTVTITAPTSGSLTNVASSTSSTGDPTPSNNDGSSANAKVITTLTLVADVKTTKSGVTNAHAGTNITYTITATNKGPSTASAVVVSDTLPTGATFVSASGGGSESGGVVTWPSMSMVNAATTNFTVTITAPASASITNVVSSTSSTGDPTPTDNDGSASAAKVITTLTAVADVKTTKSGVTAAYAGTNITYTITATNQGPSSASAVVVSDTLPTGATFVSASGGGSESGGVVTFPSMSMANAATTNFTVVITAPASGSLTNLASSTSSTGDPMPSNNDGSASTAKVITTLTLVADVAVTKSGLTNALAGTNFTYTITITNKGPSSASSVVVTDTLPATVTFVSANGGGNHASGVVTWPSMTLANAATTNFTVTVTAPASGTLTNRASSSSSTGDPDPSNNDSSSSGAQVITTITRLADVAVTKTGATNVHAGTNFTYTLTVTNKGPSTAASVVVDDTLPVGATFVSASSGGIESGGVVSWPAMTMANADTTNFTVTITAPGSGTLTNVAWSTAGTADTDSSNNNGSAAAAKVVTTLIPVADVATTKTGPTSIQSTSNLTYTVTVTNQGPSSAASVVVSDTLPAGVAFVSASSGGLQSGGVVTWPTMTMANGATTNFTVIITAPASGSLTNTVSSTSATGDPIPANNNGTDADAKVITTVVASLADVFASAHGPGSALAGTNITYTIGVTNLGPGTASNVVVFDTLDPRVVFVSASSGGLHSAGVVTWPTLTNFANGAFTNFTLTVTVPDRGLVTNTIASTSSTSDPFADNNDGSSAEATTVTLILGVNVSGYAYLDANHNLQKDTGEAGTGLTLFAKIFATTNATGPAWQAAAVNGITGAYTLTNIARGTYIIILDNNNTLSDVTPTILAGWTGTEMPAQTRSPVAVAGVAVPNQNFGLVGSVSISGKVFKDNGASGGTANDGILNGGETGLGGVTVRLTDNSGATVYDTATTDGGGSYTLLIPGAVSDGATLKVTETNMPVHLSTGASVGTTSGSYARASDTITFEFVAGTTYTGANFGDVPDNSFTTDNQQAGLPGSFVVHTHTFTAGSGGSLNLTVTSLPNPSQTGWSQVLYRDVNGNAQLDSSDTIISAAITVAAGDKIGILIKDFIPPGTPFNAQDQLTVTAAFTWTSASPALSTNTTHVDLTIVGNPPTVGLTLVKTVDKATALPGEVLIYTVTYANKSSSSLTNIIIFDETPAFTTFTSAGYGALPTSLTGIAVSAPSVGTAGAIKWTLTGNLAPASSSTVTFSVTVGQ